MKSAVVKMIKAGHPVFFGCDVGKFSDSAKGIMDTALYEYEVRCSPTYAEGTVKVGYLECLFYYPQAHQSRPSPRE